MPCRAPSASCSPQNSEDWEAEGIIYQIAYFPFNTSTHGHIRPSFGFDDQAEGDGGDNGYETHESVRFALCFFFYDVRLARSLVMAVN